VGAFHHVFRPAFGRHVLVGAIEAALVVFKQQVDDQTQADQKQNLAQSIS
jgi:hypothetical protein